MALKRDQKLFIVTRLACFDTPSDVATAFAAMFGEPIDRRSVWIYDASVPALRERLSEDLVRIFDETRKRFLQEVADIPIANKAFRLRALQRLYERAETYEQTRVSAEILEQAAKESGDVYTNRRELTGKGGAPLAVDLLGLAEVDEDEIDRRLARRQGGEAT